MKELSITEIVYLIIFLLIVFIRKYFTRKYGGEKIITNKKSLLELVLLFFLGISMITPLFYLFTGWFDFGNYYLPELIKWIGIIIFIISGWLLRKSHKDLGKSWTFSLEIRDRHKFIKYGLYRYIRHPMYTAHLTWAVANVLIIPNWIAGPSFLLFSVMVFLYRIPREEEMLIKQFGNEYIDYRKSTGSVFPKFKLKYE